MFIGSMTTVLQTKLLHWPFWVALPSSAMAPALVAASVGRLSLRVKGMYFFRPTICTDGFDYVRSRRPNLSAHQQQIPANGTVPAPPDRAHPLRFAGATLNTRRWAIPLRQGPRIQSGKCQTVSRKLNPNRQFAVDATR